MILKTAKTTGYRALQDDARVAKYLAHGSDSPRTWMKEQLHGLNLAQLVQEHDHNAAVEQTSQTLLELTDAFALHRDSTYAFRSRKWLYTRGFHSRVRRNYELLVAFMNENPSHDNVGMIKQPAEALSEVSVDASLDLMHGDGKTKTDRAKHLRMTGKDLTN